MPAINRQDGKAVIGTGGAQAAVIGVAFLVFPLLMLIAFLSDSSKRDQSIIFPIIFLSVFMIIGLVAALNAKNARYEVDDEGLRSFDLLGRKNGDIRWSEVTGYEMDSSPVGGSSFVRALGISRRVLKVAAGEQTISVPANKYGWPLLEGEISHHLPQYQSPVGKAAGDLKRPLPTAIPSNGLVLRMWPLLILAIFLIGFGGLMVYLTQAQTMNGAPPGSSQNAPIVVIGFLIAAVGILTAVYVCNGKMVINEIDIRTYNLFGQVVDQITWQDAEAFEYETTYSSKGGSTNYYILRSRDNYIRFNDRQMKWYLLRDTVVALLPPKARVFLPSQGIS